MDQERRQGYAEVLAAIADHATESKVSLARLETKIEEQGKTIERIGNKVNANSEDAANIRATVESIRNQTADQWEDLKSQGAQIAALSGDRPVGSHTFLSDPVNQRILLTIGAVVVFGLLSLAGYNVTMSDVAAATGGLGGE